MKRMESANSTSRSSGSSRNSKQPRFVVCIDDGGYEGSLLARKIYRALEDAGARREGMVRVVDESGEDYLYQATRFVPIKLTPAAQEAVLRAEREL